MGMIKGLKFTTKGGPGSGFHGHAGRPGSVGGSAPGSSWSVYKASLDAKFGEWSDTKVLELRSVLNEKISWRVRDAINDHFGVPNAPEKSFDVDRLYSPVSGISKSDVESDLKEIEQLTHWDLMHRNGGKETVMLLHGSDDWGGGKPPWLDSVQENVSMTEGFEIAQSYSGSMRGRGEGGVYQFEVPIRMIKMGSRTVGKGYHGGHQYFLKGGDYRNFLVKGWSSLEFLNEFKDRWGSSIITGNELAE